MMADRKQPVNIFHRLDLDKADVPHLKPLSLYSRMITCDDVTSTCPGLSWTRNSPFRNLKVRLVNSGASGSRKRQIDDSCLDETYETPPKKPCLAKSNSVFPAKSRSKVANSVENTCPNINDDKSDPSVLPVRTMFTSSRDDNDRVALGDVRLVSLPTEGKEYALGPSPGFDFDVDGILCLSPIDSDGASTDGLEDFIQSCQSFYEEQQSLQSFSGPKQDQGRSEVQIGEEVEAESGITTADEGYVTKCYKTDSPIKSNHVTNDAVDSSEGSVTKSYETTSPKGSKDITSPQSQTISPVMSTPLAKFMQLGKRPLLLNPYLPPKEEQFSPIVYSDLSLSSTPKLCTNNTKALPITPLLCSTENREDVVLNGGTSIHKSLECPQLKEDEDEDEHVLSVSQQQVEPSDETFWERSEASDSFESTLPLQVQVKSKVVLTSKREEEEAQPSLPAAAEKDAQCEPPERKEPPESQKEVQRPAVFSSEEDWERERKVYVNSVTRHMKDNGGAGGGVMDELLHLMNAITNQGTQSNGRKWQHPSDLTRRNYQLCNSGRLISLDEWHDLSCPKFRRFAQVPQVFRRSPVL